MYEEKKKEFLEFVSKIGQNSAPASGPENSGPNSGPNIEEVD